MIFTTEEKQQYIKEKKQILGCVHASDRNLQKKHWDFLVKIKKKNQHAEKHTTSYAKLQAAELITKSIHK